MKLQPKTTPNLPDSCLYIVPRGHQRVRKLLLRLRGSLALRYVFEEPFDAGDVLV